MHENEYGFTFFHASSKESDGKRKSLWDGVREKEKQKKKRRKEALLRKQGLLRKQISRAAVCRKKRSVDLVEEEITNGEKETEADSVLAGVGGKGEALDFVDDEEYQYEEPDDFGDEEVVGPLHDTPRKRLMTHSERRQIREKEKEKTHVGARIEEEYASGQEDEDDLLEDEFETEAARQEKLEEGKDDATWSLWRKRVKKWEEMDVLERRAWKVSQRVKRREEKRKTESTSYVDDINKSDDSADEDDEDETIAEAVLEGGFRVPAHFWSLLLHYQVIKSKQGSMGFIRPTIHSLTSV